MFRQEIWARLSSDHFSGKDQWSNLDVSMYHGILRDGIQAKREMKDRETHETIRLNVHTQIGVNIGKEESQEVSPKA